MTKQVVNLGTSANSNNGDPLRTAFTKINSNFDELYVLIGAGNSGNITAITGPAFNHNRHNNVTVTVDSATDQIILDAQLSSVIKDINGSVFADDSTLLVNAVDGNIPASVISGTLNNNVVGDLTGNTSGDHYGSVFGDDSTPLVDSIDSKINLDGTVKGNIIPDQNIAYDIGSSTKRFKDLWLSGTTINLGTAQLSATPTGAINLPAGSTIPGVTEAKLKPALVFDYRQTGETYFNDGAPALTNSTIIDQATLLWANGAREPDFQPSVYSATIDGNGNITAISLNTANYYTNTDQQWDTINTDNMMALDPGIDITDPAAVAASVQQIVLAAGVGSASDTVLASNVAPTTLLGLTDVIGDGTVGQVLTTDGAGTFTFQDPVPGTITSDLFGSVMANDSTILVDAVNSSITGNLGSQFWSWFGGGDITVTAGDGFRLSTFNGNVDIQTTGGDINLTVRSGQWIVTDTAIQFPDATTQSSASISLVDLKTLVAASVDFADFKARIAAL